MRWTQKTAPTSEPVEIAEALEHCNLGGVNNCSPSDANYVRGLIQKARNFFEERTGRQLITATWLGYRDSMPTGKQILEIRERLPVKAVKSIKYIDPDDAQVEWDSADYQVDAVDVDRPARVMPVKGKVWPTGAVDTLNALELEIEAGYGPDATHVPESIRTGLLYMIAQMYAVREPISTMKIEAVPGNALELALDLMCTGIYR